MARIKRSWEIREEELERQENAYLEKFNWFEKIIDNHLYYCIFMILVLIVSFDFGLMIGMIL